MTYTSLQDDMTLWQMFLDYGTLLFIALHIYTDSYPTVIPNSETSTIFLYNIMDYKSMMIPLMPCFFTIFPSDFHY